MNEDSESEEDSSDLQKQKIPPWAQGPELVEQLMKQKNADPEAIFPEVLSCNLDGNCPLLSF